MRNLEVHAAVELQVGMEQARLLVCPDSSGMDPDTVLTGLIAGMLYDSGKLSAAHAHYGDSVEADIREQVSTFRSSLTCTMIL